MNNIDYYLSEAKQWNPKPNPESKKFIKGMTKIKVDTLNSKLPGVKDVYLDDDGSYYFIDFEGDHAKINDEDVINNINKLK